MLRLRWIWVFLPFIVIRMFRIRHSIAAAIVAIFSLRALAELPLYTWLATPNVPTPVAAMQFTSENARTLKDFNGKVVLLNLWATWCTPCLHELPTLEQLEQRYARDGLVVIPLAIQDISPEEIADFLAKADVRLPHAAIDTSGDFRRALADGTGVPMTYLIDRAGVMRYKFLGSTDWTKKERQQEIIALLAEGKAR